MELISADRKPEFRSTSRGDELPIHPVRLPTSSLGVAQRELPQSVLRVSRSQWGTKGRRDNLPTDENRVALNEVLVLNILGIIDLDVDLTFPGVSLGAGFG